MLVLAAALCILPGAAFAQTRTQVPLDVIEVKVWDCSTSKWGYGFAVGGHDCQSFFRDKSIHEYINEWLIPARYPDHTAVNLERTVEEYKKRTWTVYYVHLKKKE